MIYDGKGGGDRLLAPVIVDLVGIHIKYELKLTEKALSGKRKPTQ
jgi:hypothetical protein